MKTYTFAQLRKLCRDQDYKMAALQGPQGDRVVPFNQYKKTGSNLEGQFKIIETRLKAEHNPDGVYFVLLAYNIKSAQNPQSFPITKGKVTPEDLSEAEKKTITLSPVVFEKPENILSHDAALKYMQEISDLKTQVATLQMQLNSALQTIEEYELEEEENELAEGESKNPLLKMLGDALPTITQTLDRHYDLQEKKLHLEELRLNGKTNGGAPGPQRKEILPGSQEHLDVIEMYWEKEKDLENQPRLNKELDKLQAANPDLYKKVLDKLGISEEEGAENE
jgi:hypothetical protein